MQRKRIAEASKGIGRPKVGGDFELVDQHGKPFTSEMMKGKHSLVSPEKSKHEVVIASLIKVGWWF